MQGKSTCLGGGVGGVGDRRIGIESTGGVDHAPDRGKKGNRSKEPTRGGGERKVVGGAG